MGLANISRLVNGIYTSPHLKTHIKLSVCLRMEHQVTIQRKLHIAQNYHVVLSYSLRVSLKSLKRLVAYGIYIVLHPDAQSALQHFVGVFARLLI